MKRLILQSLLALLIAPALYSVTIKVEPGSINLTFLKPFTVDIRVEGVADLYGAGFDVVFDPEILRLISYREGGFLSSGRTPTAFLGTETPGRLIIGITRKGTVSGVSGSGLLCSIELKPKKKGTATLSFEAVSLKDSDLSKISASWVGATLYIQPPPILLRISPESFTLKSGHSFTVEVMAEGAEDLYSTAFDLVFPSGHLEVIDCTEGALLNSDGKPTAFLAEEEDGRLVVGATREGDVNGIDGDGLLCSVRFKARKAGECEIFLGGISFNDSYSDQLVVEPAEALVNIHPVNPKIEPDSDSVLTERMVSLSDCRGCGRNIWCKL